MADAPATTRPWSDPPELAHISGQFILGYRQAQNEAAVEIEHLRSVLREVRRDIIESADDVVWMRGGIETVVDRINAAIGTEGDE